MMRGWARSTPAGIRIVLDDGSGRVIPCDVLRDPAFDGYGRRAWMVVPRVEVGPVTPDVPGFWVDWDHMPRDATLVFGFTRADLAGQTARHPCVRLPVARMS